MAQRMRKPKRKRRLTPRKKATRSRVRRKPIKRRVVPHTKPARSRLAHTKEPARSAHAWLRAMTALKKQVSATSAGARLTLELVPRTSWFSNVRTNVTPEQWDHLRHGVYKRADYVCEVCGGRGAQHPVECHEIWQYDDPARTQRLLGLIALCPSCHAVKHFGRTKAIGKGAEALTHLAAVNEWSEKHADEYVGLAFEVWAVRSEVEWQLDLGWLTSQGIAVNAEGAQRRAPSQ